MWIDTPRKNAQRETEGNGVRKVRERDERVWCEIVERGRRGCEKIFMSLRTQNAFTDSDHSKIIDVIHKTN
jgi:hypothetical protein